LKVPEEMASLVQQRKLKKTFTEEIKKHYDPTAYQLNQSFLHELR
jgi:hypothetical protein